LKVFDISNNFLLCDLKKSDIHNNALNLKNIEILNFSGIFSNKSIELLKNLEFEYLKKINLNSNNLNSVKFFEKMNCINLEELSLINNNIKEFYVFIKFKKLKMINLKQNKISSIYKLNEFLEELPDIEKINISDNLIDLNSSENEEIIEIAKEKRNSHYQKIKIIF
jgi:Leucine-rich repeat (LRR) protein